MTDGISLQSLTLLYEVYAAYEFVLKRRMLASSSVLKESLLLVVVMTIGTCAIVSIKLLAGYIVLAVIASFYELLWKRKHTNSGTPGIISKFILRQFFLLTVLWIVWRVATPFSYHELFTQVWKGFLGSDTIAQWFAEKSIIFSVLVIAYAFVIDGGAILVRGILNKFQKVALNDVPPLKEQNAGEWIGIIERIITLSFVLTGNITALAFALMAKTIARFKELEDKDFAEYYLIGTLSSVMIALLIGLMVKVILKF